MDLPRNSLCAPVKTEYILQDYVPKLSLSCLAEDDKARIENNVPNSESTSGMKRKKKLLKGQNKKRPATFHYDKMKDLCPLLCDVGEDEYFPSCCSTTCRYLHSVSDYLMAKGPDIGDTCYVYSIRGYCRYGIKCRFGSSHLSNKGKNKRDDEFLNRNTFGGSVNVLSRELEHRLRKKLYNFTLSNSIVDSYYKKCKKDNDLRELQPKADISHGSDNTHKTVEEKCCQEVSLATIKAPIEQCTTSRSTDQPQCQGNKYSSNFVTSVLPVGVTKVSKNEVHSDKDGEELQDQNFHVGTANVSKNIDGIGKNENQEASDNVSCTTGIPNLEPGVQSKSAGSVEHIKVNGTIDTAAIAAKKIELLRDSEGAVLAGSNIDIRKWFWYMEGQTLERKKIEWKDKLLLAPFTTVGNLPFRRICKEFGADVTCGEMAMATSLLQGASQEWALVRRHYTEDIFGVQICGNNPVVLTRCVQLLQENTLVDFIDLNIGCPIDHVCRMGAGSALMGRKNILEACIRSMKSISKIPITVKCRTGIYNNKMIAHNLVPVLVSADVDLITIHGRTKDQRYTKLADWSYVNDCAESAKPTPVFGSGDILSFEDYNSVKENFPHVSGVMIGRGALYKPWIFTEIKEQKHWDISSSERLDILKKYVNYGLEHWGSDTRGVENTRRFLLEWLSFLHRYIPVGLLEVLPQRINQKPPPYKGRDDLETLFASGNCDDWIRISEMLLGPVPESFQFLPKHKASSWR